MNQVVLVGPRCCGKTSVGKEVATVLGREFLDGDILFQAKHGVISDYVARHKWEGFRKAECELIEQICHQYERRPIVFAPGGGAVAHNQGEEYRLRNVVALRSFGDLIYLLPSKDLYESARILIGRQVNDGQSASTRPDLTANSDKVDEMHKMLQLRDPLYREASSMEIITGNMGVVQIAQQIINNFR